MAAHSIGDIQFQPNDSEEVFWRKIRQLASIVGDLVRQRQSGTTSTIVNNTVLADMGAPRVLGRLTGSGPPLELTGTDVASLIPVFGVTTNGMVPNPGTATGLRFLSDDGSWQLIEFDVGSLQHGNLAGLGNDDHPQYLLRSDVRNLTYSFLFLGA